VHAFCKTLFFFFSAEEEEEEEEEKEQVWEYGTVLLACFVC